MTFINNHTQLILTSLREGGSVFVPRCLYDQGGGRLNVVFACQDIVELIKLISHHQVL